MKQLDKRPEPPAGPKARVLVTEKRLGGIPSEREVMVRCFEVMRARLRGERT